VKLENGEKTVNEKNVMGLLEDLSDLVDCTEVDYDFRTDEFVFKVCSGVTEEDIVSAVKQVI